MAHVDLSMTGKQRVVQEQVPGKQVTIAHLIASPDPALYNKLELDPNGKYDKAAIGILTVSPSVTAIIAADLATKAAGVELSSVDRRSGTLLITGSFSETEAAMRHVLDYLDSKMGFAICDLSRT